jgi:hypothetical protein
MVNSLRLGSVPISALEVESKKGLLYGVLDTCDAPAIRSKLQEIPNTSACLYRDQADETLLAVAPFLAIVDEKLLSWLASSVWTEPWGIFVVAPIDIKSLLKHLRKFLLVQSPENEIVYFRYYDPRCLATFLLNCSSDDLNDFFGPVSAYAFVDSQGLVQVAELSKTRGF